MRILKHYAHLGVSEIEPNESVVVEFLQLSVKEWRLTWTYNHPADCPAGQPQLVSSSPAKKH